MIIIYHKVYLIDIYIGIEKYKIKLEELNTMQINYKN